MTWGTIFKFNAQRTGIYSVDLKWPLIIWKYHDTNLTLLPPMLRKKKKRLITSNLSKAKTINRAFN